MKINRTTERSVQILKLVSEVNDGLDMDEICERLGEKPKKRRNFKSKRAPFAPKDKQGKDSSQKSRTAKNIREKSSKDKSFKDRFSKEKSDIANNNKAKTNNNQRKNIKKYFKKNEN